MIYSTGKALANIDEAFAEVDEIYQPPRLRESHPKPEKPDISKINEDEDFYVWAKKRGIWEFKTEQGKTIDLFEWRDEVKKITKSGFQKYVDRVRSVLDPSACQDTGLNMNLAVGANEKFEEKVKIILEKPRMHSPFPGAPPYPSGDWHQW